MTDNVARYLPGRLAMPAMMMRVYRMIRVSDMVYGW